MRQPRRMAGLATVSRDFCMYDIAVLTDGRYVAPDDNDWYIRQIHQEDGLVADALRRQGRRGAPRLGRPDVDWSDCRAPAVSHHLGLFRPFCRVFAVAGTGVRPVPAVQQAALIRWNIDKHYLGDLAAAGVNITPTWFIGRAMRARWPSMWPPAAGRADSQTGGVWRGAPPTALPQATPGSIRRCLPT